MKGDQAVEAGADKLEQLSDKAAAKGGVGGKLAPELADDAEFLRKLKPSLMVKRAKGELPKDAEPGATKVPVPPPAPSTRPGRNGRTAARTRSPSPAPRSVSGRSSRRSSTGGATLTPVADPPAVGEAAKDVRGHAENVAKLGLELARTEAKAKGVGVALALGAAFVALFGLGFLLATIAVALAIVLDTWLALLLVTLVLFAVVAVLGLAARGRFQSGGETALREARRRASPRRPAAGAPAAVADLKRGVGEATNITGKLRAKLPAVGAGALGAGFFLAGGIGATMRLLARKGRER